jgi:hypothetical protein
MLAYCATATGDNLKVVWVKFPTISLSVFVMSAIARDRQAHPGSFPLDFTLPAAAVGYTHLSFITLVLKVYKKAIS